MIKIAISILIVIIPVIFIVLVIASIVGIKKGSGVSPERGHEMIKTVYVYLILFATLMMTIGGTVAAFMAVADIVSPPASYQSFEQYRMVPEYKQTTTSGQPQGQTLTDAELKVKYDQMVAEEKALTRTRAVNSLIKSFGWIVIPFPIFLFFQSNVRKQPV
ncbi:hypothetical protein REC12_22715 [Desulfosporosinus sp. PR]|uniref:hypothetical protein n=1 Tax=Candidatus Desulfosporosinus nitrosoreducens TaxID=3401928 RepID=UPI0027E7DFAB|nr:hypothetical protein [Desulfosporosinus sp. PR]MDQ7096412.1 hypothetical protein [Desulfosporosinus sp. PR]